MPIENDTTDGTRGPAPIPENPGRSLRQTSAREATEKNRLDERRKKKEKLEELLSKADKRPADERMIDKLRKELNHYTSSDAKQSDHAQAVPVAGGEVPDIERAKRKRPAQPEPEHANPVTDVEMPGNVPIAPNTKVDSTTKTRYPESGTEDNGRGSNIPARASKSPTSSPPAKDGTDTGNPKGEKGLVSQSITFQHMKDEGVEVVEEGYFQLGPRNWVVFGYGFPHGAKYEMEVCHFHISTLGRLQRLSSIEKRISILKNENGRRQYTFDNIENLVAVAVLPYGRRKGKRRSQDNNAKPERRSFRLTYVLIKWKDLLEQDDKKLKGCRSWEPRSELLGMVGRKFAARLDHDIFEMCRTQDRRNALWLKERQLSHLERPETPLPGKIEWISGRDEARKEAARARTARQKTHKAKRSEPDPQRATGERTGKMHKEKKGDEKHIPPSKSSTGTGDTQYPPEESEVSGDSEESEESEEEGENVFSYESYLAATMEHEKINDELLQRDERTYRKKIRSIKKGYPLFKKNMEAQGFRESK
ncbi:hypothetical protein N7486_010461 [Penicillium sp. IBT 16267x]|nr:hypothetical protein N7486_010461 [Penicillium sp. IBT 16267x]